MGKKIIYKNVKIGTDITDITVENGLIASLEQVSGNGIDLKGVEIRAGLIDIHTHGCIGYDITNNYGCLEKISIYQASKGITAWYPTTSTESLEKMRRITNQNISGLKGAKVMGFHLEGPFISDKKLGAMNKEYVRKPDIKDLEGFKNVKLINLAPETEGAMDFIKNCGVTISLGHTVCDYDTAVRAAESGAKCVTHIFNAMPPLHHRQPALVGAAFDKNLYVQVICDGIHIHPAVIRMLYSLFGKDRMILISDSVAPAGAPDGEYIFGGLPTVVKNSIARTKGGALAGSTANLFYCVQQAVKFGIPKDDAFAMASATPAALMGIKSGNLKVGYAADFIGIDRNMNLKFTVVCGKMVYSI